MKTQRLVVGLALLSEQSAGLALVGPTGTKDTYVQLGAWGTASSLRLKNEDGGERVVKP